METKKTEIIASAQEVFDIEIQALHRVKSMLNDQFEEAIEILLNCSGRIIVTGIGKSAIVAQKIVATFNSTGTPSIFMHAADAVHGDLGMVQQNDAVIFLSNSGESPEIKVLIPLIKQFGNPIIAITGNKQSFLSQNAQACLVCYVEREACPNNLAPTSSTTAQQVMGDALAVTLLKLKNFKDQDFAKFHPGGTLGKKLYLKVKDLCDTQNKSSVSPYTSVKEVIIQITTNRVGAVVVEEDEKIIGIITDGDIRRMIQHHDSFNHLKAKDIMSLNPKTIDIECLAFESIEMFKNYKISQIIAVQNNIFYGLIHFHDVLKEGIL